MSGDFEYILSPAKALNFRVWGTVNLPGLLPGHGYLTIR